MGPTGANGLTTASVATIINDLDMRGRPYRNYIKLDGIECHARKGWRGPARPAGTNRRRRLIAKVPK